MPSQSKAVEEEEQEDEEARRDRMKLRRHFLFRPVEGNKDVCAVTAGEERDVLFIDQRSR